MNRTLPAARRHPIAATYGLPDFLPSFAVLWQRRELLWSMTGRNIRSQYKQSILGYAWIFVNPLMQMLVLTFVFSTILRIASASIPYPFPFFSFLSPPPPLAQTAIRRVLSNGFSIVNDCLSLEFPGASRTFLLGYYLFKRMEA